METGILENTKYIMVRKWHHGYPPQLTSYSGRSSSLQSLAKCRPNSPAKLVLYTRGLCMSMHRGPSLLGRKDAMALGIETINPWGRDTVPVERQEATIPEGKEESETLSSEEDQDPPTGPLGWFRRLSPKAAGPVHDYSEDEGEKSALLDIAGIPYSRSRLSSA